MKHKSEKNPLGIDIEKAVIFERSGNNRKFKINIFDIIIKICLVFISCTGLMYCIGGVFELKYDDSLMLLILLSICIYFVLMNLMSGTVSRIMKLVIVLFYMAYFVILNKEIVLQFKIIYNTVITYYNSYYSRAFPLFAVSDTMDFSVDAAYITLMSFICILLSYASCKNGRFLLGLVSVFPFIALILACGHVPDVYPGLILSCGLFGLAVSDGAAFFAKSSKNIYADNSLQRGLSGFAGLFALVLALIAIFMSQSKVYPFIEGYFGPVRDMVYSSSISELLAEFRGGYSHGGINGGELGSGNKIKFNNEVHLIVKINRNTGGYTYLKGYSGDVYTGEGWELLPDKIYESASYSDVKKYGDSDLLGMSYLITDIIKNPMFEFESDLTGLELARMEVTVPDSEVSDSMYVCVPYDGLVTEEDGDIVGTNYVLRKNDEELTNYYDFYYPLIGEYTPGFILNLQRVFYTFSKSTEFGASADLNWKNYVKLEEAYREIVYEYDLDIPDHLSIIKEEYGELVFDSVKDAVIFVQKEVARDSVYTLEPEKVPYNKDFIEYFMYEKKEGYCTYYASAAVMIFRAIGIPARFAQGYLIPPSPEDTEIYIDDSYAHAWAEIYIDGFGWVPVEVTPGSGGEPAGFSPEMNKEGGISSRPVKETEEESGEETEEDTQETEETTEKDTEELTLPSKETKPSQTSIKEEESKTMPDKETGAAGKPLPSATSSESDSPAENVEEFSPTLIRILKWVAVSFIGFCLMWCFLYTHRRSVCSSRRRRFNQKSSKNSCLAIYRELCRMTCRYLTPVNDNSEPSVLSEKYPVEEAVWREVFRVVYESAYSSHEISDDKKQLMLSVYHKCRRHIYNEIGVLRKMIFVLWDSYI